MAYGRYECIHGVENMVRLRNGQFKYLDECPFCHNFIDDVLCRLDPSRPHQPATIPKYLLPAPKPRHPRRSRKEAFVLELQRRLRQEGLL